MVHYTGCPLCHSSLVGPAFDVKDHTVSRNMFSVWECKSCTARFTQDIPGEEEIGTYYLSEDYISHTETRKGFVNKAYHAVRNITLQQKRKMIVRHTAMPAGRLLDIGCGTGAFLQVMAQSGWTVQGLEPDPGAREIAASRGVPVLPSGELSRLTPGFDAITMWHVLEHVHNLHGYLQTIAQLLTGAGRLFVAVPNFRSADAAHYGSSWAAYDVPRHLYHFSPESVKSLMKMHGLEVVGMSPMWFDSIYVSMLSEKYARGKDSLISACWQGLRSNLNALGHTDRCSSVIYTIRRTTS